MASRTKQDRKKSAVTKIFLGSFRRVVDLCISQEDGLCWVLNDLSGNINTVDIRGGRLAGTFGDFNGPQSCHYLAKRGQILVVDEAKEFRGALIRFLDATTGIETRQIRVEDWRAYRISSTVLSEDQRTLWLVTSPTSSSLHGDVSSVMYQIDLRENNVDLCVGEKELRFGQGPLNWRHLNCTLGYKGRLFLSAYEPNTISEYDIRPREVKPFLRLAEPIGILACDTQKPRLYASLEAGNIAVVNTDKASLLSVIETKGCVTAMCFIPETNKLAFALAGSPEVEIVDTDTFRRESPVPLPGTSSRQENHVRKMLFDRESNTLIAPVRKGSALALYDFKSKSGCTLDVGRPTHVRMDPAGKRVYVCHSKTGNISVVDVETGKCVGTIQIGGSLYDMDFLPDTNCAVIADIQKKRIVMLELNEQRILKEYETEAQPHRLMVSEDGKSCLVSFDLRWGSGFQGGAIVDLRSGRITKVGSSELSTAWPNIPKHDYQLTIECKRDQLFIKVPGFFRSQKHVPVASSAASQYLRSFGDETACVVLSPDKRWAWAACEIFPANAVLLKIPLNNN